MEEPTFMRFHSSRPLNGPMATEPKKESRLVSLAGEAAHALTLFLLIIAVMLALYVFAGPIEPPPPSHNLSVQQ